MSVSHINEAGSDAHRDDRAALMDEIAIFDAPPGAPAASSRRTATRRGAAKSTQRNTSQTGRSGVFVRLGEADKERAQYWADKRGYSSLGEYVSDAVVEQVRRENLDFDIPDLMVQRLNQLIDELKSLSINQQNLERVVMTGFESLIGLTRGDDNYLSSDEDGEL